MSNKSERPQIADIERTLDAGEGHNIPASTLRAAYENVASDTVREGLARLVAQYCDAIDLTDAILAGYIVLTPAERDKLVEDERAVIKEKLCDACRTLLD